MEQQNQIINYKNINSITSDDNLNTLTTKAIKQLEKFNSNTLSSEYKQAVKMLVFDILYYNRIDKILTVPLPTGSGKSTITELVLASMYLQPKLKEQCGTIILKLTIDDCNETAERINQYVGKDIAYAYHSGEYNNKKSQFINADDLMLYPILVLTHEGFKKYTQNILSISNPKQEEKFTLWTNKKVNKIMINFNAFNRSRLIIDEEISNIEPVNITMDKINKLENIILNMGSNKLFDEFNNFIINIKKQFIKSYSEKANKLHFVYFNNIEVPDGLDEAIFDTKNVEIKDNYLALLNLIYHGGYVKYADKVEDKTITTYKYVDIFNPFFHKIQLDATANVNILYKNNENYYIQDIPKFKTYKNAYLHIYNKITGSRTSLVENSEKGLLNAFIKDIDNKVDEDKRALVIFNDEKLEKPFTDIVNSIELINRIDITHYGRVTGTNKWQNYDFVFVIGINIFSDPTYPIFYYCNNKNDIFGSDDVTMIPKKGSRVYVEKKFEKVRTSMVASKLIQALNRIKIRKYINGDVPETHMYVINSDSEVDKIVAEAMPGINILYDWDLDYEPERKNKKINKVESNTQKIINCIKYIIDNENHPENMKLVEFRENGLLTDKGINKKALREYLGFKNRSIFNRAINNPMFKQFCIDYHIDISNAKLRYIRIN